ncbi:hypothetical protein CBR_g22993 [Chara braunii]|uniref:Uncharacterized protein n=1 Tax=Chara braunii TaxID=69332 RepID=A0A388L3A1_CHABU|nr:hypothetical protein CBR_g22993 [Chara braunii]|eukprot:GBG76777.1 hypothetical protein CBR_g22993 [Chara braunii]
MEHFSRPARANPRGSIAAEVRSGCKPSQSRLLDIVCDGSRLWVFGVFHLGVEHTQLSTSKMSTAAVASPSPWPQPLADNKQECQQHSRKV